MNFLTAAHTDVGIKKKTNQDSLIVQQAVTDAGTVLFAAMCDGMGGLAKGEVASACMVNTFADWFRQELPGLLERGLIPDELRNSWMALVERANLRITGYGSRIHVDLGTTCVAFLAYQDTYYIMNIGDSRAYLIADNIYQLTKDHTYVQREMDANRMTYEQSLVDPQRSVLLQCVGASDVIEPDFFVGNLLPGQCYLLCCDGFRHVIQPAELFQYLNPSVMTDPQIMKDTLVMLTEMNKQRMETDNISAALIRTY